jgi:hypothetical protein
MYLLLPTMLALSPLAACQWLQLPSQQPVRTESEGLATTSGAVVRGHNPVEQTGDALPAAAVASASRVGIGMANAANANSANANDAMAIARNPDVPRGSSIRSGPVSVTIRSSCSKTVRVFFGIKPKFGSGTTSSISSNSSTSHSFAPGDMMWLVDAADNGVASVTVATGMREIQVGSNCTSLAAR